MKEPLTISTAPAEHPAMNYALLRQEGIRYLERMAGSRWTDFNTHDPGITILEQLCYAITDLGYRIAYEIPDLVAVEEPVDALAADPSNEISAGEESSTSLARAKDANASQAGEPSETAGDTAVYRRQSFFSPAEVLTSHPVTLTDLRKLVLDVDGVKNAWIEEIEQLEYPTPESDRTKTLQFNSSEFGQDGEKRALIVGSPSGAERINIKGLYRVLIEKWSPTAEGDAELLSRVKRQLHSNRSVCTDFAEIRILKPRQLPGKAVVEIGPVEDANVVLRNILRNVAEYLSPSVRFATLQQMLAAGKTVDEIFDGPRLVHGFIDTQQLQGLQRRTTIHKSDLIRVIMDTPGVKAVRSISLTPGNFELAAEGTVSLQDDEKHSVIWSLATAGQDCPIVLQRGEYTVSVNQGNTDDFLELLKVDASPPELSPEERDIITPRGRNRRISNYFSIQHQFPANYGIGQMGLPASASDHRKVLAQQLKAYLLFFDQLLANAFAQLARAHDLFSNQTEAPQTYFSQWIDDPRLALHGIRGVRWEKEIGGLNVSYEGQDGDEPKVQVNVESQPLTAVDSHQVRSEYIVTFGITDQLLTIRTRKDPLPTNEQIVDAWNGWKGKHDAVGFDLVVSGTGTTPVTACGLVALECTKNPFSQFEPNEDSQRRHRFLNHLLARFSEKLTDYSLILGSGVSSQTGQSQVDQLMLDKQRFLQDYPRISSARGTGYDYTAAQDCVDFSGLEHRIRLKLGLAENDFYVVEHILLRPIAADGDQQKPVLFAAPNNSDDGTDAREAANEQDGGGDSAASGADGQAGVDDATPNDGTAPSDDAGAADDQGSTTEVASSSEGSSTGSDSVEVENTGAGEQPSADDATRDSGTVPSISKETVDETTNGMEPSPESGASDNVGEDGQDTGEQPGAGDTTTGSNAGTLNSGEAVGESGSALEAEPPTNTQAASITEGGSGEGEGDGPSSTSEQPPAVEQGQRETLFSRKPIKDPYSLQLSFVFPDSLERFRQLGIEDPEQAKDFIETTVRQQTPAHLTTYIHWLGEEQMKTFECLYQDWRQKLQKYSTTAEPTA